uniref:Uncharacterized protein n=1 Tax=Micrurus corallinus TaxID=54390 RepID=A0A2D4FSN6_MICCO
MGQTGTQTIITSDRNQINEGLPCAFALKIHTSPAVGVLFYLLRTFNSRVSLWKQACKGGETALFDGQGYLGFALAKKERERDSQPSYLVFRGIAATGAQTQGNGT